MSLERAEFAVELQISSHPSDSRSARPVRRSGSVWARLSVRPDQHVERGRPLGADVDGVQVEFGHRLHFGYEPPDPYNSRLSLS